MCCLKEEDELQMNLLCEVETKLLSSLKKVEELAKENAQTQTALEVVRQAHRSVQGTYRVRSLIFKQGEPPCQDVLDVVTQMTHAVFHNLQISNNRNPESQYLWLETHQRLEQ